MRKQGQYNLNGAGWTPLEELPPAESFSELYQFSEELLSRGVANKLALGSYLNHQGNPVLTCQVFVPPVYAPAWDQTVADFYHGRRTHPALPSAGVGCILLAKQFAKFIGD